MFSMDKEFSSVTRMDSAINMNRGSRPTSTVAGWSRKQKENGVGGNSSGANNSRSNSNHLLSSVSASVSLSSSLNVSQQIGGKRANPSDGPLLRRTPCKTPRSSPARVTTPSRIAGTPGRAAATATTPGGGGGGRNKTPTRGDRFIPSRSATDFEAGSYRLLKRGPLLDANSDVAAATMSPSKRDYQRKMAANLLGSEAADRGARILAFADRVNEPPEGSAGNAPKVMFGSASETPDSARKRKTRNIPAVPERILDAPELINDFYLNLIDWSSENLLAVALGVNVYIWNAASGEIRQLLELSDPEDHICAVKFVEDGDILAVGTALGSLDLWNVEQMRKVRAMRGHDDRVGCLAWNKHILTSGSRSGRIIHSDVRVANHVLASIDAHRQEVCGLTWSPDGRMLASGGNDNVLKVWEAEQGELHPGATPKYVFNQHLAAVKALAWCPWQPGVLASGGGTSDGRIRIWNCNTGALLNTVDTRSQVCSVLWSPEYRELVSSHGHEQNEVAIWRYPAMVKVAELLGHSDRVLHLALSPDGSTLVSGGADETLRLWKCFVPDPRKPTSKANSDTASAIGGRSASLR